MSINSLQPSTGIRDIWAFCRPAVKTDLINKTITIPKLLNIPCGPIKQSVLCRNGILSAQSDVYPSAQFTVEFWLSNTVKRTTSPTFFNLIDGAGTYIKLSSKPATPTYYTVEAHTDTDTKTMLSQGVEIPYYAWYHVAMVYDGSNILLYINGVLSNTVAIAGTFTFTNATLSLMSNVLGYMDELRIWNTARTSDQIQGAMFSHRGLLDATLKYYWKFSDALGSNKALDSIVGEELDFPLGIYGRSTIDDTQYFPFKYGASFECSRLDVVLDRQVSLVFPVVGVVEPRDHALFISWTDSNGEFQRRKLYSAAPVMEDISPSYPSYNGELLGQQFSFEIWNVDGNQYANVPADILLRFSHTTQPQHGSDSTAVVACITQHNTLLASGNFPVGYPITFVNPPNFP